MVERYYSMAMLSNQSKLCLFCGIVVTKGGEHLRSQGSLSYTCLRLNKLSHLGFHPKQFGLHSLQAGGASTAANAGVPDRLFKHHGHWCSASAKDGYVKDSVTALMSFRKSELMNVPTNPFFIDSINDFWSGVHIMLLVA